MRNISRRSVAESGKTPRTEAQHLVECHSRHEYASSVLPGACFASTMWSVVVVWRPVWLLTAQVIAVNLFWESRAGFVNLSVFPYAGRGLLFFRWQQRHFDFQPAHVAVEGISNVVLNMPHARLQISLPMPDFLAYCTRSVSVHFVMACWLLVRQFF